MRVMLAGPSGIGKTTLAKDISKLTGIEFISGSVSDLLPETKEMSHESMLNRESKQLYTEDYQILNLRNKLFKEKEQFVSDRSYLDSVAYFLYKQADQIPACEVEHFISIAGRLLNNQCDLLIVLELVPEDVHNWITEDNKKRITSNYFQILISSLVHTGLRLMGYETTNTGYLVNTGLFRSIPLNRPFEEGRIKSVYGETDVLIIRDLDYSNRFNILKKFICPRK